MIVLFFPSPCLCNCVITKWLSDSPESASASESLHSCTLGPGWTTAELSSHWTAASLFIAVLRNSVIIRKKIHFVQGHNFLIQKLLVILAMVLVSLVLTCYLMDRVSLRRIDWEEMCLSDCDCWATAVMSFSLVGALPGFVSVASSVTCSIAVKLETKGGRSCDRCDEVQLWQEQAPPPSCSGFLSVWEVW